MSVATEPSSDGIYFCLVRQLCSARLNTWDYKGKTKHGNGDKKPCQKKSGSVTRLVGSGERGSVVVWQCGEGPGGAGRHTSSGLLPDFSFKPFQEVLCLK